VASQAAALAVELAERKATEAWEAAKESSLKASCGKFKEAQELATKAKTLAAESETAEHEAAKLARRAGPSLGADGKRAWATYGAVHGASARAAAAAAAANAASEFKAAAKAYCDRILLRKVFKAWAEYSEWLKPLRAKAGRALSLFKNNSVGRTFYAYTRVSSPSTYDAAVVLWVKGTAARLCAGAAMVSIVWRKSRSSRLPEHLPTRRPERRGDVRLWPRRKSRREERRGCGMAKAAGTRGSPGASTRGWRRRLESPIDPGDRVPAATREYQKLPSKVQL
jgi:hypothetical protein